MTTIHKLSIQGVRSFSDKKAETIEFLKPLTIIVGHNGSGKTTIIEALKFITTGQQPPLSDNGKSFVHDPGLCGSDLVKAQVRLQFEKPDKQPVLALRSFQVARKKTKMEFKALEAVLRMQDENGEVTSLSKRCAEMDKMVPRLMGVSRAVLENVVFCHQEDSNWPLADSRTLKEKFDEIFSATAYTKALDHIRKLRTQQASRIKELNFNLMSLEKDMETMNASQNSLDKLNVQIMESEQRLADLEEEHGKVMSTMKELGGRRQEARNLKTSINKLEARKAVLNEERHKLLSKLESEYACTDEELQEQLNKMKAGSDSAEQGIELVRQQVEEDAKAVEASRLELGTLMTELGRLQAEQADLSKKESQLETESVQFAQEHNLPKLDSKAIGGDYSKLINLLDPVVQQKSSDLKAFTQRGREAMAALNSALNGLVQQQSAKEAEATRLTQQISADQERLATIDRELGQHNDKLAGQDAAQRKIKAAEKKLAAVEKKNAVGKLESKIDAKDAASKQLRNSVELLAVEKTSLEKQAGQLNEITYKQNEVKEQTIAFNKQLMAVKKAHTKQKHDGFSAYDRVESTLESFTALPVQGNDRSDLDHYLTKLKTTAGIMTALEDEVVTKLSRTQEEITATASALSVAKTEHRALTSERNSKVKEKKKLEDAKNGDDAKYYEMDMKQLKASVEHAQSKVEKASAKLDTATLVDIYGQFLDKFEKESLCALCGRGFDNEEEGHSFQEQVAEHKAALASKTSSAEKAAAAHAKLTKLQALLAARENMATLDTAIEKLDVELTVKDSTVKEFAEKLDEMKHITKNVLKPEQTYAGVYSRKIDALKDAATTLSSLIDSLDSARAALGGDVKDGRTLEVVSSEHSSAENAFYAAKDELEDLRKKMRETVASENALREEVTAMKQDAVELSRLRIDIDHLVEERATLQTKMTKTQTEAETARDTIAPLQSAVDEKRDELDTAQKEQDAQVAKMTEHTHEQLARLKSLKELHNAVSQAKVAVERQVKMESELADRKTEIDNKRKAANERRSKLAKSEQKLRERRKTEADIALNVEYRAYEADFNVQTAKVAELVAKKDELTRGNQLAKEITSVETASEKLKAKISEEKGRVKALTQQANEHRLDLDRSKFKGLAEKFKQALIAHRSLVLVHSDLDLYMKALDKSLMHFHSLKMKEINTILREYWIETYQGKDIDEVYIKAEEGKVTANRRTYNYSVVMRQGDTELKMRGRCSAGQKVLASLLIRLALAETFCLQMGVLALDEPTTNLDEANIKAFAGALTKIIDKRRKQENFQLILITHDDNFVELIGKRGLVDVQYRIAKDPITLCSTIRVERINV